MYSSLLVPIDGSGNANKALEVAAQLARPDNGELYLLHIPQRQPENSLFHEGAEAGEQHDASSRRAAAQAIIESALDVVQPDDVHHHILIREGEPAEVIEREAIRLDVDAVVMGYRGLGKAASQDSGSISRAVNQRAACRVITVK